MVHASWRQYLQLQNNTHQRTYLNSSLLMAPREYVLHGLNPGLYWTHIGPLLTRMHLVATPNLVYNCLWQRFKFSPQGLLLSGWLLTNVQVNITTAIYDTGHTLISITLCITTIHVLLYTSSILLGKLAVLHSLCPLQIYLFKVSGVIYAPSHSD